MSSLVKIILAAFISIFLVSCNLDINLGEGEKGNGNVVSENRNTSESFNVVKATEGLDVYVTQAEKFVIRVEADENIIDLIQTDVNNGVLRIHTEKRIGRAKSKKVYVSLPDVAGLKSSSGADLYTNGVIKANKITLDSSSGADLKVEIEATEINADASSGADIVISGKADILYADASSGSDIKAMRLVVEKCNAQASSGADISVNATKELITNTSSGGDVNYKGDPIVKKSKSRW